MLIAISGMIASGKSTLIRNVSEINGWSSIEEPLLGMAYLEELFFNPERWAFEAQVAFLVEKATLILKHNLDSGITMLDRCLEEDANIFFKYFYIHHLKPQRANIVYNLIYKSMTSLVRPPDIQVICTVSLDNVKMRINQRPNKFNNYYDGHIDDVFNMYQEYIKNKMNNRNVFFLNSDKLDWRDNGALKAIASELSQVVSNFPERDIDKHDFTYLK